jgi:hypothetical protein
VNVRAERAKPLRIETPVATQIKTTDGEEKHETFAPKESQSHLLGFSDTGHNRLPGHRQNYPDADQNSPAS